MKRFLRKVGDLKVFVVRKEDGRESVSRETKNVYIEFKEEGGEKVQEVTGDPFEAWKEKVKPLLKKRCKVCGRPIRDGEKCVICEEKEQLKRVIRLVEDDIYAALDRDIEMLEFKLKNFLKTPDAITAASFMKTYEVVKKTLTRREREEFIKKYEKYVNLAKKVIARSI